MLSGPNASTPNTSTPNTSTPDTSTLRALPEDVADALLVGVVPGGKFVQRVIGHRRALVGLAIVVVAVLGEVAVNLCSTREAPASYNAIT